MPFILVTNDDGYDSPSLVPLVRALSELAPVRAVVPASERSWIGKAISRFEDVTVERADREGCAIWRASGFPADCTQLGIHTLFDEKPELVVSGINVGFNHGLAFFCSSGTVGGAIEGWIAGIPASRMRPSAASKPQSEQRLRLPSSNLSAVSGKRRSYVK